MFHNKNIAEYPIEYLSWFFTNISIGGTNLRVKSLFTLSTN